MDVEQYYRHLTLDECIQAADPYSSIRMNRWTIPNPINKNFEEIYSWRNTNVLDIIKLLYFLFLNLAKMLKQIIYVVYYPTYIYIHGYTYIYIHAHTYVCVDTYVYIYIYIS